MTTVALGGRGAQADKLEDQQEKINNLGEAAAQHATNIDRLQRKLDTTQQEIQDVGPGPQVPLQMQAASASMRPSFNVFFLC